MDLQPGKPKMPPSKPRKDEEREMRQAIVEDADKTESKDRDLAHGNGGIGSRKARGSKPRGLILFGKRERSRDKNGPDNTLGRGLRKFVLKPRACHRYIQASLRHDPEPLLDPDVLSKSK
jgi:hypothetical protein